MYVFMGNISTKSTSLEIAYNTACVLVYVCLIIKCELTG